MSSGDIVKTSKYNYMKIQLSKEVFLSAVKLGASRQVAIPKKIHDQLHLHPGDYLEIEVKQGRLIFTPKALVDKRLGGGIRDLKTSRVYGPFHSAREMMASLKERGRFKKR